MLSKRLIILNFVYAVFCLILMSIYTFTNMDIPVLLEGDVFSYKLYDALFNFFEILPSIVLSVFFVVVATYIERESVIVREARKAQSKVYTRLLVHIGVIVCFLFCFAEICEPLLNRAKVDLQNKCVNYNWYIQKSRESYDDNDINSALYYIDSAIDLHAGLEETVALKELYERSVTSQVQEKIDYFPELSDEQLGMVPTDMNVYSLLEQARRSYQSNSYLDAHYYATIGLELGTLNDPNSAELQKIAREAWEEIATWSGFEAESGMELFATKREGYTALMNGDYLAAYYIFLDLWNEYQYDPDISRYYELAKNALLNQYFFLDEINDLTHFESSKNLTFVINRKDGLKYDIHIGGITNVSGTGMYLKYLRDYTCTIRDSRGTVVSSFFVPYAKLIGEPLSSFNNDVITTIGFDANTVVPRLVLTSVDRNTKGVMSGPTLLDGSILLLDETVTVLPMQLDDLDLIIEATRGPRFMNLASLYKFIPKSEAYGFSTQIYSSFFLKRISAPFLLFCIFLLVSIIAWNFRLREGIIFRAYWLFIIPAFTVLIEFIRIFVDYFLSLFALACANISWILQLPVIIIVSSILIFVLSMRFLYLFKKTMHNEQ